MEIRLKGHKILTDVKVREFMDKIDEVILYLKNKDPYFKNDIASYTFYCIDNCSAYDDGDVIIFKNRGYRTYIIEASFRLKRRTTSKVNDWYYEKFTRKEVII